MSRLEKLNAMLLKSPGDPFLYFGRAMELIKGGRLEEAVQDFDRSIALAPGDPAAYYHKADTLIGLGQLDDARRTLTDGLHAAAECGDAHAQSELRELLESLP